MKKLNLWFLVIAVCGLAFAGCSDDDDGAPPTEVPELAFVGSDACMGCHTDEYTNWHDSGHPYKLTKIDGESPDAKFPTFSYFPNDPIVPPAGYTWADISYTIGGYGWKMRWIDSDGYIITQLPDTQYNFENQTRVAYSGNDAPGTKKYNCGKCHTSGWVDSDDGDATNNQDGLEGMVGTFFAGGVHCEECHGMGSQHVFSRDYEMTVHTDASLCGRCHTRDEDNHIASSGGFIKHHEQYDEWLHSPHNSAIAPSCNDCHDPHSGVKFDSQAAGMGTTTSCTDCHMTYAGANLKHNGAPSCVDCHMPKATKSAIAADTYVGDTRTHIWSINTAAESRDDGMFIAGGGLVIEDAEGQSAVTLDFACYSCHDDGAGNAGTNTTLTLQQLSDFVTGADGLGPIHPQTKAQVVQR